MIYGILAGLTWGAETVIIGIALSMTPFLETSQAIVLAPFVSTFLHDAFSAIFATIYNLVRGNAGNVWQAFKSKDGKWVILAAAIGGPIGMGGYTMTINYMGASIGAVSSAIFPAIGAVLARIFLKEKMRWYQWIFLIIALAGVYGLSYSPELDITNFWLGLVGALMCSFGWGIEAVIVAHGLKSDIVKDDYALQLRQTTSALCYGIIVLPLMGGWKFTTTLFTGTGMLLPTIMLAALFATVSYLCYYRAISRIGAAKSMALNVSYTAWAILFTVLFLHDTSVLNPQTILCAIVVLISGIFAATDFKSLFSKNQEVSDAEA